MINFALVSIPFFMFIWLWILTAAFIFFVIFFPSLPFSRIGDMPVIHREISSVGSPTLDQ
jgi:hypothetical protein